MSDFMVTHSRPARATASQPDARHLFPLLRLALRTCLTRRALPQLTARERADIGISASAAVAEAARLPWDINPGPRRPSPGVIGTIQRALHRARTRLLTARLAAQDPK
ncbi:DUF1127 domain-containing protein [Acidisphaera sp. S103]|uniref:DUF1127 domain-containing protein n=1 Tax=Acidisphaera sp. S103 TaxID=1747223 RepID=UPI00131D72E8|nr:DUF1127 domain-containing protein [Acidisphaera sp. S103]